MSSHVISSILIYPPMLRLRQRALDYVSDWQLFPDEPNESLSPSHGDTTSLARDEDTDGETEMK